MSTYQTVKVMIWHPSWTCDPVEVMSEDWPRGAEQPTFFDSQKDYEYARTIGRNTGMHCTIERTIATTYEGKE
jgi:hypothetical protein